MEKLLKLFLSLSCIVFVFSCSSKREKAEAIYNRAIHYPQGSMMSINGIKRATEIDSTYDDAVRELSVAYLKRGLPHKWKPQMDKAVKCNPVIWQGYRGYNYLWFYRDYKKAIADFNATDSLTPNFTDAPQGHSVNYWRGIAYLGLKDYKQSIAFFELHIEKETEAFGEDYVDVTAFLYNGIANFEAGNHEMALYNLDKQLEYSRNLSADAKYYKAQIFLAEEKKEKALKTVNEAISDFNQGYNDKRPYVETIRQIYFEDLSVLKTKIENL